MSKKMNRREWVTLTGLVLPLNSSAAKEKKLGNVLVSNATKPEVVLGVQSYSFRDWSI